MSEILGPVSNILPLFDTHCHLQTEAYDADREEIFAASRLAGVKRFLVPAIDLASFESTVAISESNKDVDFALGIHPHSATEWTDEAAERITQHALNPRMVAVGEIGLDYHYDFAPREVQKQAFCAQIELAQKLGKPVIIHTRESDEDVFSIVEEYYEARNVSSTGQFHCFSGSIESMQKAVALGFYVSFTGNITFKKSTLNEVVKETPLDYILLETDSPYLSPVPFRGKRNSPVNLKLIAEKIAEIKEIEVDEVIKRSYQNACRLFGLPTIAILLAALSIFTTPGVSHAQRSGPIGKAAPDSIMTPERRREEELRKKQAEALAKEAEQQRQDSTRAAEKEQQELQVKMHEQARQDSIRAAEKIASDEQEKAKMQTPIAWKAIGIGGGFGVGNVPEGQGQRTTIPTAVFATTLQIGSQLTRRLDVELSYTHLQVGGSFVRDSVYNYGVGGGGGLGYNKSHYGPNVRLVPSETLDISNVGFDLRYMFTKPSAMLQFYLGVGYERMSFTSEQPYYKATPDSIHFESSIGGSNKASFSRGAIKLLIGVRHDFELGSGFILTPFMQVAAQGALNGDQQDPVFDFRPEADQIVMTHVLLGATMYFGWFGVSRQ